MNVEIVVPTRNGARWLRQFLVAYRKIGVEPLYIVDARSEDETLELLQSECARIAMFHTDAKCVEGGALEFASVCVQKDWILRIDDDEFPSSRLICWAEKDGCLADVDCWWISRLNLIKTKYGIRHSRIESRFHSHPHIIDAQPRLYRHRRVEYSHKIHQAGFIFSSAAHAPENAIMIHCDALLRSVDQRLDKLRQYEAVEKGSSWKFAYEYLPELFPRVDQRPELLPTKEFDTLINSLPRPRPTSTTPLTEAERETIAIAAREHQLFIKRQWTHSPDTLSKK